MFGFFKSKEQTARDKFLASDVGRRFTTHNEQYFGPTAVWGGFSPETKQQIIEWLMERIVGVYGAPDPLREMRLELAAMASCYAELTILLKGPFPDELQSRYISGELHNHIRSCSAHCKELAEEVLRNPAGSDAALYGYTNARSVYYTYVLNGISLLRYDFDDFAGGQERDWLRPFVKSMLIWHEDIYRSKINLPRLFEDDVLSALQHSTFFNLVRNGVRNPLSEWESDFGPHKNAC